MLSAEPRDVVSIPAVVANLHVWRFRLKINPESFTIRRAWHPSCSFPAVNQNHSHRLGSLMIFYVCHLESLVFFDAVYSSRCTVVSVHELYMHGHNELPALVVVLVHDSVG